MVIIKDKICSRCVLDDSCGEITYDDEGVCNYCQLQDEMEKQYPIGEEGLLELELLSQEIKKAGKKRDYDVVVGVSGGCDSTFMLKILVEQGLRCLAVHYDNGWNTDTAIHNMYRACYKLGVTFISVSPDRKLFNNICKSFLLADVSDADVPNDIALATVLYQAAAKYKVKYIANGHSFRTEGTAPTSLTYMDAKYINSVFKTYNDDIGLRGKNFPNMWLSTWLKWMFFNRIKRIRPVYYFEYNKKKIKRMLTKELGWEDYGSAHMENEYTMFCSNFYQPLKFGIDLRKVIFSGLIRSGQMDRASALKELKRLPPLDKKIIDKVKKELNLRNSELNYILRQPRRMYSEFDTYKKTFRRLKLIFWIAYKLDLVPKTFYEKYCRK